MKVLIVEDERVDQEYLMALCNRNGFDAIIADNAKEAVRLAKSEKPILAIVDMQLKCSRGVDFINRIKVGFGLKTKIIVHTGNMDIFDDWKDKDVDVEMKLVKGQDLNYNKLNNYLSELWTQNTNLDLPQMQSSLC